MNIHHFFVCMKAVNKNILEAQIVVYLEHRRRTNNIGDLAREWLTLFLNFTHRNDIMDVEDFDEETFLRHVYQVARTRLEQEEARKAIQGLRRYYEARGKNINRRDVMGRPPHISEIEQIKQYRKMGLKLKEIEKLTGKKLSWVHRAVNYVIPVGKK